MAPPDLDPRLTGTDPAAAIAARAAAGTLAGTRALLLGLGRFGGQIAAARYLARHGAIVTVTDPKPASALPEAVAALAGEPGIVLRLGAQDAALVDETDLVVCSPAVPFDAPPLARALATRVPVTTEIALTLVQLRAPVIGVTGANGKSTTVSMLARALAAGTGRPVHLGGNIGRSLLEEAAAIDPGALVVLELSSFQLAWLARLPAGGPWPRIGVLTQLAPNHLDRHGSFERYADAKRTLFARLPPGGFGIVWEADDAARAAGFLAGPGRRLGFGIGLAEEALPEGIAASVRASAGRVWLARAADADANVGARSPTPLYPAARPATPGAHNLLNALAALAACQALAEGDDPPCPELREPTAFARAAAAALAFEGLPHRLARVAAPGGIAFVNDSKATTEDAAIVAIEALAADPHARPLVWLGGGAAKGARFERLARVLVRHVDAAILYGDARHTLEEAIAAAAASAPPGLRRRPAGPERHVVPSLDEAVPLAARLARPRGAVLLSPACASYDQFSSYEARGERFAALAQALGDLGRRRARPAERGALSRRVDPQPF